MEPMQPSAAAAIDMQLPNGLEALTLARFDDMSRRGFIFYQQTEAERLEHNGFKFEFRTASIFKQKPIMNADAPGRSKAQGPFMSPRLEEKVSTVGKHHRLLLNKYCIYRPMLVLPTIHFAPQTDDLDMSDLTAVYAVLRRFETHQMAIFNCGVNAGSSQGHKHMQIFARPSPKSMVLWPSQATPCEGISSALPSVPFKHFVQRLSNNASLAQIKDVHDKLLAETRKALNIAKAGSDYNVVMTTEWMAFIPRSTSGENGTGPYGANAAGMLGMVTVPDQKERQWWADLGYTDYLEVLGVARDQ